MSEDVDQQYNPQGGLFATWLFVLIFLFFWVGVKPFPDIGGYIPSGEGSYSSNPFNQILILAISIFVIVLLALHPGRSLALHVLVPVAFVVGLMALTLIFVEGADHAPRRLVFACLVCLSASVILILPRDNTHFARLMGGCFVVIILLCYFGVTFLPQRSIHQISDAMEPALAGDWRGYFQHKNMAAACMAMIVFFSLYLIEERFAWIGLPIAVLSVVMLIKSGGKTSAVMLPTILMITWVFERLGPLRLAFILCSVALINIIVLSVTVSSPAREAVVALGIDPTFTDRAAIWVVALSAIGQQPLTGYGFQSFWGTNELVYGVHASQTWAVTASSAHNAYLDQLINGGWPLLCITMVWLVVLPALNAGKAIKRGADPHLTRLYLRIWLFVLFASSFESFFFDASGPIWFTMLIAIFGLRLQAHASLKVPQTKLQHDAVLGNNNGS